MKPVDWELMHKAEIESMEWERQNTLSNTVEQMSRSEKKTTHDEELMHKAETESVLFERQNPLLSSSNKKSS